jgi:hypothetical protein
MVPPALHRACHSKARIAVSVEPKGPVKVQFRKSCMVGVMRTLLPLLLLCATTWAGAQATQGDKDALALAVKSQRVLNEYVVGAVEPEAMKYAQRLRLTKTALDAQRKEWPAVTVTGGPDPWDNFRACKNALEKASYVAELSGMKAISKLDGKVFDTEKGKLQKLRADCDAQVKQGNAAR